MCFSIHCCQTRSHQSFHLYVQFEKNGRPVKSVSKWSTRVLIGQLLSTDSFSCSQPSTTDTLRADQWTLSTLVTERHCVWRTAVSTSQQSYRAMEHKTQQARNIQKTWKKSGEKCFFVFFILFYFILFYFFHFSTGKLQLKIIFNFKWMETQYQIHYLQILRRVLLCLRAMFYASQYPQQFSIETWRSVLTHTIQDPRSKVIKQKISVKSIFPQINCFTHCLLSQMKNRTTFIKIIIISLFIIHGMHEMHYKIK